MADLEGEKEPIMEEMELEEPTPEELLQKEIEELADGEQVRIHDLSLPGTPMKCMIYRSPSRSDEVVRTPQYHQLEDSGKIIGYQRWNDRMEIQPRGTDLVMESVEIVGTRQRGE